MVKKKKTTRHALYLKTVQEENMALLFSAGVAFGVALTTAAFNLWYPALASLAVLLVLWMVEKRN